jgi:hypothetical protein
MTKDLNDGAAAFFKAARWLQNSSSYSSTDDAGNVTHGLSSYAALRVVAYLNDAIRTSPGYLKLGGMPIAQRIYRNEILMEAVKDFHLKAWKDAQLQWKIGSNPVVEKSAGPSSPFVLRLVADRALSRAA